MGMDISACTTFLCNLSVAEFPPSLDLEAKNLSELTKCNFYCDLHSRFSLHPSKKERKGYFKLFSPVMQIFILQNCILAHRRYYKLECHLSFAEKYTEDLY